MATKADRTEIPKLPVVGSILATTAEQNARTIFEVELNGGLGTAYPSGAIIGLMLQLEDPYTRIHILVDVMDRLNISLDDLVDQHGARICNGCGVCTSPKHPCDCPPDIVAKYGSRPRRADKVGG